MQTVNRDYRTCGITITVPVPATVEDFDENAKKKGACLESAVDNVVYRSFLADFRDLLCTTVEERTNIERRTKPTGKKNSDGSDILKYEETEGDYINRVCVEKGWTEDKSTLQKWATELSPTLSFDASAPERKPTGPKKLPVAYKEAAERIFNNGREAHWADQLGLTLIGDKIKDIEALGWKIKWHEDEKRKAEVAKTYV